jgi:UDP-N-acetylmuramyl pentapeptide phosphotransferase/UDP-N-acetylglucosamine-1-phosphate transferase
VLIQLLPALAGACTAFAFGLLLTAVARRVGWVDGGAGAHKLAGERWPLTGGAALLAGWLAAEFTARALAAAPRPLFEAAELAALLERFLGGEVRLWPLGALCAAFALGSLDDLLENGLSAGAKLCGQAVCGLVLVAPSLLLHGASSTALLLALLAVAGACIALNCINTFDNADGAALGVGLLGLSGAATLAAPLVGFAPLNLISDRPGTWRRKAILGDAGSHALGLVVLLHPHAWPALTLPALDLARLCWVRWCLGEPVWRGDRRHLAHRLAQRGMAPWRVALLLVAVAAPAALAPWGWELAAGIAASAALLVWSLRCAPQSAEPSAAGAAARPNAGALAPAGADANVSAAGTART